MTILKLAGHNFINFVALSSGASYICMSGGKSAGEEKETKKK